jgi:hypothetical protein
VAESDGAQIDMAGKTWPARHHDGTCQRTSVRIYSFRVSCHLVILKIRSWVFREPVDPIALGIPQYYEVIPKKDARDLKTIRSKLDNDRYGSVDTFEAELDLMVNNAIAFNGEGSDVGLVAVKMRDLYRRLTSEWRSNLSKKRKDSDQSTPQPAKRAKTS